MKKYLIIIFGLFLSTTFCALAQTDTTNNTFWKPQPRNYEVKQALEVESLVPMFLFGGYHYGVCYRYKKFRVRISVINGGTYDVEPAGLDNSSNHFKRFYKPSPGVFFGYNIWKNLETYTYVELHTFGIEQKSSGTRKDLHSTDFGAGISYQFFIGRIVYIQPGFHVYLRSNNSVNINGEKYNIPNVDLSPVIRLGFRYWRKY